MGTPPPLHVHATQVTTARGPGHTSPDQRINRGPWHTSVIIIINKAVRQSRDAGTPPFCALHRPHPARPAALATNAGVPPNTAFQSSPFPQPPTLKTLDNNNRSGGRAPTSPHHPSSLAHKDSSVSPALLSKHRNVSDHVFYLSLLPNGRRAVG